MCMGEGASERGGGYLFAHMSTTDYGSMYYSVSEDGVNWKTLNGGKKICGYRGHPDFCRGRDGRHYMIGVEAGSWEPLLWVTENFVEWKVEKRLPPSVFDVSESGFYTERIWYNAPKMFFDEDSGQYIITWHPANLKYENPSTEKESRDMWRSIRTFYVLTKDFESFTKPERLFRFAGEFENMPTMDAIIRKSGGKYYAFIKDERWPEDIQHGFKAVRWTKSDNLIGPWQNPSGPVTDAWTEAQTLVRAPDGKGWNLYVEFYPHKYGLYAAPQIEGPWRRVEMKSPDARHGSVVEIDAKTMRALREAYPDGGTPD